MEWGLISFGISTITGSILIIGLMIDLKISEIDLWPITKVSFLGMIELTLWFIFYGSTLAFFIFTLRPLAEFNIIAWIGSIIFLAGFSFFIWSILILNFKETFGVKGEFCSKGPYRICRNPQSTGIMIKFLGAILMTSSILMIILTILHATLLLLTVFAEEPWLREHYGENYEKYKKKVPYRFIPYVF